jgi:hypothetical protein
MKKMHDLAINPRKGRKKGKAVRINLVVLIGANPGVHVLAGKLGVSQSFS